MGRPFDKSEEYESIEDELNDVASKMTELGIPYAIIVPFKSDDHHAVSLTRVNCPGSITPDIISFLHALVQTDDVCTAIISHFPQIVAAVKVGNEIADRQNFPEWEGNLDDVPLTEAARKFLDELLGRE